MGDKLDIDILKVFQSTIENQQSIKHLISIQEKTSQDIDRLVEKQSQLLLNQTEMKVLEEKILENDNKISIIFDKIQWISRTLIGSIFSVIIGIIILVVRANIT